jgi:hypothetical protein
VRTCAINSWLTSAARPRKPSSAPNGLSSALRSSVSAFACAVAKPGARCSGPARPGRSFEDGLDPWRRLGELRSRGSIYLDPIPGGSQSVVFPWMKTNIPSVVLRVSMATSVAPSDPRGNSHSFPIPLRFPLHRDHFRCVGPKLRFRTPQVNHHVVSSHLKDCPLDRPVRISLRWLRKPDNAFGHGTHLPIPLSRPQKVSSNNLAGVSSWAEYRRHSALCFRSQSTTIACPLRLLHRSHPSVHEAVVNS